MKDRSQHSANLLALKRLQASMNLIVLNDPRVRVNDLLSFSAELIECMKSLGSAAEQVKVLEQAFLALTKRIVWDRDPVHVQTNTAALLQYEALIIEASPLFEEAPVFQSVLGHTLAEINRMLELQKRITGIECSASQAAAAAAGPQLVVRSDPAEVEVKAVSADVQPKSTVADTGVMGTMCPASQDIAAGSNPKSLEMLGVPFSYISSSGGGGPGGCPDGGGYSGSAAADAGDNASYGSLIGLVGDDGNKTAAGQQKHI